MNVVIKKTFSFYVLIDLYIKEKLRQRILEIFTIIINLTFTLVEKLPRTFAGLQKGVTALTLEGSARGGRSPKLARKTELSDGEMFGFLPMERMLQLKLLNCLCLLKNFRKIQPVV